uniref:ABC transporter ATP-binding protein n=1 Tax=uncultured Rhizobium sp. TaxID=155567 RepID=UPI0026215E14|nr:ATP-binding cassette domain-containing protein [uncultured Rhizobium sp.]
MISIENLVVQFGGVRPIDRLTAKLSAPVSGLIGPNGAGKTTLLNVLSGFVRPIEGKVTVKGQALLELSALQRVRAGLRRSFQTEQVVEDLTVLGNLAAIADHVLPAGERAQSVSTALDFVRLGPVASAIGGSLNLFQRRLVELGKCVVGAPKLILLDEPAAGLSTEESAVLRELILRIPAEYGAQVLVIDHDVDLIRAMCAETLVLDYGRMLALGPTDEVLASADVRRAYLGEF